MKLYIYFLFGKYTDVIIYDVGFYNNNKAKFIFFSCQPKKKYSKVHNDEKKATD